MDYILPQTSLCGDFMYCGLAVVGIYGVYSDVPEDVANPGNPVTPDDDSFPAREALELKVYINGSERCIQKKSLKWSRQSGGTGTSSASLTVVSTFTNRPRNFMIVQICVGSLSNLLYAGIITNVSDAWFSKAENISNYEYEYQVTAVGYHHYLVRRQIDISATNKYASDIIRKVLSEYLAGQLRAGSLTSGLYYEWFSQKQQSAANILQQLGQDSDAIFYITPERRLNFFEHGDRTAPFNLTYSWSWAQGWDLPDNNFSDVTIEESGEQVVTRLLLHAAHLVEHEEKHKAKPEPGANAGFVSYVTNTTPMAASLKLPGSASHTLQDDDVILIEGVEGATEANGSWTVKMVSGVNSVRLVGSVGSILHPYTYGTGRWYLQSRVEEAAPLDDTTETEVDSQGYYTINPGQRQFTTEQPIAYVESIYAKWTYYRPYDGVGTTKSYTWRDPMGVYRSPSGIHQSGAMDTNEQLPFLANSTDAYLENVQAEIKLGGMLEFWKPTTARALNWELAPEESGRSLLEAMEPEGDPPTGVQGKEEYVFPFDWKINYGSNTIEFNADIETTETDEVGKIRFLLVQIKYHEKVNKTFPYQDYSQKAIISNYDPNSDGIIEANIENRDLITPSMRNTFAQAFFNLRAEPRFSVSYTHIAEQSGVINQDIYPGMTQTVAIHGYNTTLMVESVSYEVINGTIPIIKMSIQLATKQKDLASLVKKLLGR